MVNGDYSKSVSLAMSELREETDRILEECEIVSNKISHEITDGEYIIRCEMICLKDIAETAEFTYEIENVP